MLGKRSYKTPQLKLRSPTEIQRLAWHRVTPTKHGFGWSAVEPNHRIWPHLSSDSFHDIEDATSRLVRSSVKIQVHRVSRQVTKNPFTSPSNATITVYTTELPKQQPESPCNPHPPPLQSPRPCVVVVPKHTQHRSTASPTRLCPISQQAWKPTV